MNAFEENQKPASPHQPKQLVVDIECAYNSPHNHQYHKNFSTPTTCSTTASSSSCGSCISSSQCQSPATVAGISVEQNTCQLLVSLNGSVEVEMISDAVSLVETMTGESTTITTPAYCIDHRHCPSVSALVEVEPFRREYVTPNRRIRSAQPTTSFPSHIPFPLKEEDEEEEKSSQEEKMASSSPTRFFEPSNDDASRTQKVIEGLQEMNADSEEEESLTAAALVGVESILRAMRHHTTNARVQRYGCGVLQKLACQNETNRTLIVEAGGISSVINAMNCYLARSSVQECGCLALSALCKAPRGGALIVQHQGIEAILGGMRVHREHVSVQRHGCLVLLGIACGNPDHNSRIANLGGIQVIMAAISCHRGDSGVREYGSALLWSLAYMNTKNTAAIEEAGGLDAVFNVLSYIDEETPRKSQEDHCMQLIRKQASSESAEGNLLSSGSRGSIDAILSVFVRPLQ